MSTYRNFAVVGYGFIASKLVAALAQKKTEGAIDSLVVLSRSVCDGQKHSQTCILIYIYILG